MKTLVAVKIKLTGESEIFEFKTMKAAMSFFHRVIKKYGDTIEIIHTVGKIERPQMSIVKTLKYNYT